MLVIFETFDLVQVLLLVVFQIFDPGHQSIFVGLACRVVGETWAATSVGGIGERIERLIKLDAVGTSTRAVVFVRRIVADN